MSVDKYELGEKMIALASQYRQMGDNLSITAFKQFTAGKITKDEYDELHHKAEEIFNQASAIHREVAGLTADSIETDLKGIENATEELEKAADRVKQINNIINISIETITAIGTVVLACTTPNPATISAAVESTKTLADDIIKMTS
jgi:uncharacterized coiled-coil DUF342 family protein